jgi:hypothetical protein
MIVVVGGHTRNIGKTTLMCELITATRDLDWTAVKITQFANGVCGRDGEACSCAPEDPVHPFSLREETEAGPGDSQRYLAAGARSAWWLRTRQGQLAEAMPALRRLMSGAANLMIESNSVLDFLTPDLYFAVLHPGREDFKPSALRHLSRASFVVQAAPGTIPVAARGRTVVTSGEIGRLAEEIRRLATAASR